MWALMRNVIRESAVHPIPLSPGQASPSSLAANGFLLGRGGGGHSPICPPVGGEISSLIDNWLPATILPLLLAQARGWFSMPLQE